MHEPSEDSSGPVFPARSRAQIEINRLDYIERIYAASPAMQRAVARIYARLMASVTGSEDADRSRYP